MHRKHLKTRLNDSRNQLVSPKRPRRSAPSPKILLGELKRLFCMQVNENHVREFTEKIKSQANTLGGTQIVSRTSTGDMTTNEYYHKTCLKNFNNHYLDNLLREEKNEIFGKQPK